MRLFQFLLCLWSWAMVIVSISPKSKNPYQIYNYTWVIYNQAGDIVNASSHLGSQPHLPMLEVDFCALALVASTDWVVEDTFWPNLPGGKAPEIAAHNPNRPGLRNDVERMMLYSQPGIYVCPGGHGNRALNNKCGFAIDFYCASWGCKTTGDTYWNPTSSWDYILVKQSWDPGTIFIAINLSAVMFLSSSCHFCH